MSLPNIRSAIAADSPSIANMIIEIQREEFGIPITLEDQPDLFDIDGYYHKGKGGFFVATVEDEIVGTIALIDIGNGEAALRKMFVKQAFRGKEHGIAAALLTHLLSHASVQGLKAIYLGTIEKFLAARRFYEKNGFHEIPPHNLPANFPRMAVDTNFYAFNL